MNRRLYVKRIVGLLLLAGLMLLATSSGVAEENILTTKLELAKAPKPGGQGTLIWCGIADRPIPQAILTLTVTAAGQQALRSAPQTLKFAEGVAQDVTLNFATPVAGLYSLVTRVDWQDGEGAKSKADTISMSVGVDGKIARAPLPVAFSVNNNMTVTNVRQVTLYSTCVGSPTQARFGESEALTGVSWTSYTPQQPFTLSNGAGMKTVYYQVKDAAGVESEVMMDSIRYSLPQLNYPSAAGAQIRAG